jgi:hypothetical protein
MPVLSKKNGGEADVGSNWCRIYKNPPASYRIDSMSMCSGVGLWDPCEDYVRCRSQLAGKKEECTSSDGSLDKIVCNEPPPVLLSPSCPKNGKSSQSGQTMKQVISEESDDPSLVGEQTVLPQGEC